MKTSDFHFELPAGLIAQYPSAERGTSRLLVMDRAIDGQFHHAMVADLDRYIPEGALMVFNDSKVRRARLFATSTSTSQASSTSTGYNQPSGTGKPLGTASGGGAASGGGKVEVLLLRREAPGLWAALTTRMARQTPGKILYLPEGRQAEVVEVRDDERLLRFPVDIDEDYLERNGHLPLPPYIHRADEPADAERYQTVYARVSGSAAAPTAGLHFTPELLERLGTRGIELCFVTLHVGLGTFIPVRTDQLEDHRMHEESYTIPETTALAVNRAKAAGRPVVAVGTTSVRTLESAWEPGGLRPGSGTTSIFIYPGYRFKVADMLFTNFHTPGSTLLMLVSAFASRERILTAYEEAVRQQYRFFSYGDAMLIR